MGRFDAMVGSMRKARLIQEGGGIYHCVSRFVDKSFCLESKDAKEFFRNTMRKLEEFLGVRVLTYCLMSNHFHILVQIPDRTSMPPLTEDDLRRRLPRLYSGLQLRGIIEELDRAAASTSADWMPQILSRYENRMCDLSHFIRSLKQRFSFWHNARHHRKGTLWEERFKSVLVEGNENALLTMAAYIDLNPVRAGLVEDPKDYRWSGYGEAMGGGRQARQGLGHLLTEGLDDERHQADWGRTAARYRMMLYDHGEERQGDGWTGQGAKRGFDREKVEAEIARGGQLTRAEALRCRVRYFCDGAVFGTAEFVNRIFEENRWRYSEGRSSGARKMRGADWGELRVLRDLQKEVIRAG